jgi:hypothetical protein
MKDPLMALSVCFEFFFSAYSLSQSNFINGSILTQVSFSIRIRRVQINTKWDKFAKVILGFGFLSFLVSKSKGKYQE